VQVILNPQNQVFWYLKAKKPTRLLQSIKADVVIVGGGMSGLSAAQQFAKYGCSVVLLERWFCGGGASGKSSGFITPDAELGLSYFAKKFGDTEAKKIWDFVVSGVHHIKNNIESYNLSCDYRKEDTLVLALDKKHIQDIQDDHNIRQKLGYESTLYQKKELSKIIASSRYYGAVRYHDTFGISPYKYCQEMKDVLISQGVKIYEETPVLEIKDNRLQTPRATVEADSIVVCVDRFLPELHKLSNQVFHVQTFLMASSPLTDHEAALLFPDDLCMCWDTAMVYTYFRLNADNRFLIGGNTLICTYDKQEHYNPKRTIQKLTDYVQRHFPHVSINFEYCWPGLIGISKDVRPIAGRDKHNAHIYYVAAATGLPWAAALGNYSADHMIKGRSEFDELFSPYRSFLIGDGIQSMLGKRLAFALNNFYELEL
jgi:gamma-glutamylputrescine oxidase